MIAGSSRNLAKYSNPQTKHYGSPAGRRARKKTAHSNLHAVFIVEELGKIFQPPTDYPSSFGLLGVLLRTLSLMDK